MPNKVRAGSLGWLSLHSALVRQSDLLKSYRKPSIKNNSNAQDQAKYHPRRVAARQVLLDIGRKMVCLGAIDRRYRAQPWECLHQRADQ